MEREIKDFRLSEEYYFTIAKNMVDHIYKDDDDDFGVDLEIIKVINDCITFDYDYELTSCEGYLPCIFDDYDNGEDDGSMEEFVAFAFETFDCELLKRIARDYEMEEYGNDSVLDVYLNQYGIVMKIDWEN